MMMPILSHLNCSEENPLTVSRYAKNKCGNLRSRFSTKIFLALRIVRAHTTPHMRYIAVHRLSHTIRIAGNRYLPDLCSRSRAGLSGFL